MSADDRRADDREVDEALTALLGVVVYRGDPDSPRAGINPLDFSRTTTRKLGRPRGAVSAQTSQIRDAVLVLQDEYDVMTVRQVFYALTVRGIVAKEEAGYRQVQRQVLQLRRDGILPWSFIADGTRWVHAPETWDGVDDVLQETARTYRRNLWRSQRVRIEVWLEKDALASIVKEVTYPWGVRLMVSRGQSSDTYCHHAAQEARRAWIEADVSTIVYTLYDADKSGRIAAEKVGEKLSTYSEVPITFNVLAVTDEQIRDWHLPSRPAKEKGEPDAVELDAIPPDRLKAIVETAITAHIEADAWEKEQAAEASERTILKRIAGTAA